MDPGEVALHADLVADLIVAGLRLEPAEDATDPVGEGAAEPTR